jgi:hypothetical protein
MGIITQPPRPIVSAYRPIQFEVFTTGDAVLIPQNAVVKLYVKGVLKSTFSVKSTEVTPNVAPNIDDYKFCIDVSDKIQGLLAPFAEISSVFVLDCPTIPTDNTDSIANFYLDISYEWLNTATNLIETQLGVNDVTNEFWAVNITRQDLEPMYLDTFTVTGSETRALTNSPKNIEVCREANIFLSYVIAPDIFEPNAYRVVLYDSLGGVIGDAYGLLNSVSQTGHVFTFNTGIENGLKCLVNAVESVGFDLDDPNISYYTIDIGFYLFATYLIARETFTYTLQSGCKCCEKRKFRLHWLNCLGGVDSFTFCSIKELRKKTSSVTAEKALPWDKTSLTPHNPTNSSRFKTRTNNNFIYRVVSQDISNSTASWLSEMLGNVSVYLELESGQFIPVLIQDSEHLINKESGKRKLELTIELSSCEIKQSI